ncbi:glucose 1-dehydrogenase [Plantactinospora sp. S1510]|uniref:Glucose 1-dehydrogenase n=1 Tax=Plantactinospora alkalitolerans TaxID=2789879 RepID=A0ABS0H5N7_9ACTN|nr:glucose 1-dehydrogenase [Plantactinospora alkalitolerans]MBF9133781.1 glucose 1-dehydrogenase [Plantactinospora alkalitolerans]
MTGRLSGRTALITGSDSGIGQATAIEFGKEGADVVVHYLHDHDGAQHTREQVERAGRRAVVVQGDISDEDQVAAMFDRALEFGDLDVLINDAGVDASGIPVVDLDTETWDRAIRVNVYGAFFCSRRFAQHRRDQGGKGKIINITSVHQEVARAGGSDYDASKGALLNLSKSMALELAPLGINVNNIGPGMVLTPFNQKAIDDPKYLEEQVQSIPFRRAAEPVEIGRVAVFLASSDADYVTGSTYFIDGGLMQNQGQGA